MSVIFTSTVTVFLLSLVHVNAGIQHITKDAAHTTDPCRYENGKKLAIIRHSIG